MLVVAPPTTVGVAPIAASRRPASSRSAPSASLVDDDPHAGAGDEAQVLRAVGRRPRLLQRDVGAGAVVRPHEGLVHPQPAPELLLERGARQVDPRGRRQRERDVVRRDRDPDDPHPAEPADPEVVADPEAPGLREALLDHDLVRRPARTGQVAPRDDRVPPAGRGVDELERPAGREVRARPQAHPGDLGARAVGGDVRQRQDPLADPVGRLVGEAGDDVGQVGLLRGAVEATAEREGDGEGGAGHRARHEHADGGQHRAPAARAQERERAAQEVQGGVVPRGAGPHGRGPTTRGRLTRPRRRYRGLRAAAGRRRASPCGPPSRSSAARG